MFGDDDQQQSTIISPPNGDDNTQADDLSNSTGSENSAVQDNPMPQPTASDDPVITPPEDNSTPVMNDDVVPTTTSDEPTSTGSQDLVSIKKDALEHLTPLIDKLDQTSEEKFKTTMMMIQASDDQSLIQTAFNAAKEIADEKTRAKALLDVVNEINYFTQQNQDDKN